MENELSEAHSSAKQDRSSSFQHTLSSEGTKGLNKSIGLLKTAEPLSNRTPHNGHNEFLQDTLGGTNVMVSEFVPHQSLATQLFQSGFPGGDLDKLEIPFKSPNFTPLKNK